MSIVYAVASVLILKLMVWPALTLISVAKPWILGSPAPAPLISQLESGVPGKQFSASIAFAGALQLPNIGTEINRHKISATKIERTFNWFPGLLLFKRGIYLDQSTGLVIDLFANSAVTNIKDGIEHILLVRVAHLVIDRQDNRGICHFIGIG